MADITPDPIMRIALGFMAAKHLFVASAIGLFERLAGGPATLDELATNCGVPRRTLGISVDAMRDGERYHNSAAAAAFLAGTPGPDLRPLLRVLDRISYGLWMNLEAAVRAGEGQRQFGSFSAEQQEIFSAGVEASSAASAVALAANYDFGRHRRVLDIAGGTGSFLIPILRRYPALQATLFELPGACAVARQRLASEPEGARVSVVDGDFFTDPLPGGHDVLIVANTVHVLSVAHNLDLLKAIRAGVEADARLLLVDMWMDPTHAQPPAAPLMSGEFLVAYGEDQADAWLGQTGWRKLERRPLAGPASVIIAEAI